MHGDSRLSEIFRALQVTALCAFPGRDGWPGPIAPGRGACVPALIIIILKINELIFKSCAVRAAAEKPALLG
jgi:hypothetical protein